MCVWMRSMTFVLGKVPGSQGEEGAQVSHGVHVGGQDRSHASQNSLSYLRDLLRRQWSRHGPVQMRPLISFDLVLDPVALFLLCNNIARCASRYLVGVA